MFAIQNKAADIHWVHDGYEALEYLLQNDKYAHACRPDLILLDLNMPRISGFEVLKKVKDNSHLASIPVIILTTSRDPLDHTQCKSLGADMCLTKPHALKDYETLVNQLMNWAALAIVTPGHSKHTLN